MSKFIKYCLCVLFVVITLSGGIMEVSFLGDFLKISSNEVISLDETDTSKFEENSLISGDIHYIIDIIATSNEGYSYYLIPLKSESYIVLATKSEDILARGENLKEQTGKYLKGEIGDTTLSITIEGKLIPTDDDLSELLYQWSINNSFDISIEGQTLPYVIYTQNFDTIKNWSIIGIVMMFIGIIGFILVFRIKNQQD